MDPDLSELSEDGSGEDEVAAIIRLGRSGVLPQGVRLITQFGYIITVRLNRNSVLKVNGAAEVDDMAAGWTFFGPDVETDTAALPEIAASFDPGTDNRRPPSESFTGRGVTVGVVDWGFDFAHPDFRNADGTSRILALWDQRGGKQPGSPQPFGYGKVHTRDAINRALKSDNPYAALGYHPADADTGGGAHGTHVASIAAGTGGEHRPVGVAPEADLVFVHNAPWEARGSGKLGDSVTLLEAIDFIARTAGDHPWVINLSMGRHGEQHDGSTLVEQGLDAVISAARGRAICMSAGNYFNKRIHSSGQLRPTEERTFIWEINEGDPTENELEIWYPGRDKMEVEIRSPDHSIVARVKIGDRAKLTVGGKEIGNIYHGIRDSRNLDNHINVFLYKDAFPGKWEVMLLATDVVDGRFHAWIERDAACPKCQSHFRAQDAVSTSTTGTICNGFRTIAVGAYDNHDPDMRIGRFSSVGPTRDGRLKPDLCAPGVSVLAARSAPRIPQSDAPLLTQMSGTSMAAPCVTGTVALMFQAAPLLLRIEETRNLLLESARRVVVPEEIPDRVGIGYLDTEKAVEAARTVTHGLHVKEVSAVKPEVPRAESQAPASSDSSSELMTPAFEKNNESEPVVLLDAEPSENDEMEQTVSRESTLGPSVSSLSMREPTSGPKPASYVKARLLWPALGFPAVIAPHSQPLAEPTLDVDATRCITILLLSDTEFLSKEEAARYLRYVPWSERGRRHIPAGSPGSFREEELTVRNDTIWPPSKEGNKGAKQSGEIKHNLIVRSPDSCTKDKKRCYGELIVFGGDNKGAHSITVNLAHRVLDFYKEQKIQFLHEIRVSEEASARLKDGHYNLFWNNEIADENAPSEEMALLIGKFAQPRRQKELDQLQEAWKKSKLSEPQRKADLKYLWDDLNARSFEEYEYEYGTPRLPKKTRAEILHPLFVERRQTATLRVGHITDTHVHVRADVYEENLRQAKEKLKQQKGKLSKTEDELLQALEISSYSNWNKNFINLYQSARQDSDIILLTGDLIDYGRGHLGVTAKHLVGNDHAYTLDRNWFLFHYLLASREVYTLPVYTILGNHDWRINPYPPFAAGAPETSSLITGPRLNEEQREKILQTAHGPGFEPDYTYIPEKDPTRDLVNVAKAERAGLGVIFLGHKTLNVPGFPTETDVESVAWYLLAINPFFDYWFSLPSGHSILMLDWAEEENVQFGVIYRGKKSGAFGTESALEGPTAKNCLTDLQKWLVERFAEAPGRAKIIGIHAPPIGPWYDWYDGELASGWKSFDYNSRGYPHYSAESPDGKIVKGHPLFAIRPAKGIVPDAVYGMDATYNSFENNRRWFLECMAEAGSGVRLVLAGHIHRAGMFVAYKATEALGSLVAGETLIKSVLEREVRGIHHPAAAQFIGKRTAAGRTTAPGPLYINGTSAGPRGHSFPAKGRDGWLAPGYMHAELANDGTIQQIIFRWVESAEAKPSEILEPEQLSFNETSSWRDHMVPTSKTSEASTDNIEAGTPVLVAASADMVTESNDWRTETAAEMQDVIKVEDEAFELVELADQIVEATPARSAPVVVLHEMLSRSGNTKALADSESGVLLDAAEIFDSIVYHSGGLRNEKLKQGFEVVALPGASLDRELRKGDVRVLRCEGDLAHVSVISDPKLRNLQTVIVEGLTPETFNVGNYAQVIESGAEPHTDRDGFARQMTDSAGRLLNDILLLRLATPSPTTVTVQQAPSASPAEDAPPPPSSSCPTQIDEVIRGWGRYKDEVSLLPQAEQDKIQRLADAVVSSFTTVGCSPLGQIIIVGHADTDFHGPQFEKKVSDERATSVAAALATEIMKLWKARSMGPFTKGAIAFLPSPHGVGATEPDPSNVPVVKDRELNRRIEISLRPRGAPVPVPPLPIPPLPPKPPTPPGPPRAARPCCMLAPTVWTANDNLADPASLGTHGSSSEVTGLVYTGKAGFVDLGHLRDLCDMTKNVFDQIAFARAAAGTAIQTAHGQAVLSALPPGVSVIAVARSICFDDSFGYEILTYGINAPGAHNSSFSPEDLPSNFLGTLLAERAIAAGGSFNSIVSSELDKLIKSLDPQPKSESLRAFNLINARWVSFSNLLSITNNDYLRRRNFTFNPWKTGHSSDGPTPSFFTAGFGLAGAAPYTYTHTFSRTIAKSDFGKEVALIRTDASTRYGPDFDKA